MVTVNVDQKDQGCCSCWRKIFCVVLGALVLLKVVYTAEDNKKPFDSHGSLIREALGGKSQTKGGNQGMMRNNPGRQRPKQQPVPKHQAPLHQSTARAGLQPQNLPKDYDKVPSYIKQNCDLRGIDYWMVPEGDWRRQVAFLILGEKKSGTTGLFQTLNSHPQVIPGRKKELIFFNPKRFKHWEGDEIGGKVKVASARRALFNQFDREALMQNRSLITGEGTPEYLLYPDICDKAILCTIPWVKTIAIIREPVDRLYSHYNFLKDPTKHNATMAPFETFVKRDIDALQTHGVLPETPAEIPRHMGSKKESDAYLNYQYMFQGERQFVRSLYALQLEGWSRALQRVGKDPKKDLHVVISAQVKSNPKVTGDLLEWLGLPPSEEHKVKEAMITKYTSVPIDPKFKEYLNSIIAPYNKRK